MKAGLRDALIGLGLLAGVALVGMLHRPAHYRVSLVELPGIATVRAQQHLPPTPPYLSGSVTVDVPFSIKTRDGYTFVTGTVHRLSNGDLYFKGNAQRATTQATFDEALPGKHPVLEPKAFGFSGAILLFAVQFDRE